MIMTRKGSLMPKVLFASAGHETKVVEMLVDMISSTLDWMSLSVMRLMWPFWTTFSQIWSGFEPAKRAAGRRRQRAAGFRQAAEAVLSFVRHVRRAAAGLAHRSVEDREEAGLEGVLICYEEARRQAVAEAARVAFAAAHGSSKASSTVTALPPFQGFTTAAGGPSAADRLEVERRTPAQTLDFIAVPSVRAKEMDVDLTPRGRFPRRTSGRRSTCEAKEREEKRMQQRRGALRPRAPRRRGRGCGRGRRQGGDLGQQGARHADLLPVLSMAARRLRRPRTRSRCRARGSAR